MAHLGKQYKLQFRRDLAFVTNNRNAYPEGMLFGATGLSGAVGNDIDSFPPLCVNLLADSQPPMIWTSDILHAGGIDYTVTVTITAPEIAATANVAVEVKDANTGAIYLSFSTAAKLFTPSFSTMGGIITAGFTDSPQCKASSGSFFWGWNAALWSQYSP